MKCWNCGAEVSDESEQCGKCGYNLPGHSGKEAGDDDLPSFFKDAIVSPWKSIGRPYRLKTAFTALSITAAVLLAVGVWQMVAEDSDPFPGLQFVITLIPSLFFLALSFVIFYILTLLFQEMVTREIKGGRQVFIDFTKTMILLYGVYILFALTITSLPENMRPVFWFVIYFLTISVPVFITVKYAGHDNAKFNISLSVLIYYVVIHIPIFGLAFLIFYIKCFIWGIG